MTVFPGTFGCGNYLYIIELWKIFPVFPNEQRNFYFGRYDTYCQVNTKFNRGFIRYFLKKLYNFLTIKHALKLFIVDSVWQVFDLKIIRTPFMWIAQVKNNTCPKKQIFEERQKNWSRYSWKSASASTFTKFSHILVRSETHILCKFRIIYRPKGELWEVDS